MKIGQLFSKSSVSGFMARGQLFARGQWLLLYGMILTAATTYRYEFWTVARPHANVFPEFQGIVLFLPDYFLALRVVFTLLHALLDRGYAAALMSAADDFITHRGGIFWLGWLVWIEIGHDHGSICGQRFQYHAGQPLRWRLAGRRKHDAHVGGSVIHFRLHRFGMLNDNAAQVALSNRRVDLSLGGCLLHRAYDQ